MKKSFLPVIVLFLTTLLIISCNSPHQNQKKKFDVRLNKFNRSLRKADKTLDMMDAMTARKALVEADYRAGRITEAEARRRLAAIDKELNRQISGTKTSSVTVGLPDWAKALGLTEPENMVLDKSLSQITSEDRYGSGFNSVTLVYKGSYAQAMTQAKRIAALAKVPLIPEYRTAMEMKKKYGEDILKGAVYMNFEPGAKSASGYNIAITVDAQGVLTISAADATKMEQEIKTLKPENR
jgi:hypothetical protein